MSGVLGSLPNFVANTKQQDGKGFDSIYRSGSEWHWLLLAPTHLPYGQVYPSQPNQKSQNEEVHVQMSRTLLRKVSSQVQWLTSIGPAYRRLKLED